MHQYAVRKMVGYEKGDKLSSNEKLVAGCLSGCLTRFATQPVDVIKLRIQLQKKLPDNKLWFPMTRIILKEKGVTGFWHGHLTGQIHSIFAVSAQFYVFEISTQLLRDITLNKKTKSFICGVIGGCSAAIVVNPLEVIRVRQMILKDQYGGLLKGAQQVYKTGGILAFYEGLSASLLQTGPAAGISFGVFSIIQPLILSQLSEKCEQPDCKKQKTRPVYLALASSLAGAIAGFTAKTITYPLDLVKRRLQMASQQNLRSKTGDKLLKCTSLVQCLSQAIKKEGVNGLYRGWLITAYKAQLTSVVAFTSYEMLCYFLREFMK